MAARLVTKCANCEDLLWFAETDILPQSVQCTCTETILDEDGPKGNWTAPTAEELASIP